MIFQSMWALGLHPEAHGSNQSQLRIEDFNTQPAERQLADLRFFEVRSPKHQEYEGLNDQ